MKTWKNYSKNERLQYYRDQLYMVEHMLRIYKTNKKLLIAKMKYIDAEKTETKESDRSLLKIKKNKTENKKK